jgi:hypothetical protein
METSISQIVHDKMILESEITRLLVDFIQKYPGVKLSDVDISFLDCKSVGSGIVSTCVNTDISIKL